MLVEALEASVVPFKRDVFLEIAEVCCLDCVLVGSFGVRFSIQLHSRTTSFEI